jgi:internalin A
MPMKPPTPLRVNTGHLPLRLMGVVLALSACASVWAAAPSPVKTPTDNATSRRADHEARRAKFQQLCANPTPSQRETLKIWAKGDGKIYGPEFCGSVEYKYFGTKERPKTWHTVAFGGVDNIRDYSPIQYFGNVLHLGIGSAATDLSPIANYTELERFSISDSKETFDISVIANFKNLKTLSLQNTQVVSLAPLAGLSKLETLNLHMDAHTGLPGRKGLEALRYLKSLKDLSIDVAEPLGDQLKGLQNLQSLVIYGPVNDVCSLKGLKQLTSLYLVKSGIRDISCLKDLKELAVINLRGNPITSIAELAPLPMLRNLHIKNTLIEDLSALTGNPNAYIFETDGAPLRWCSPKTAKDIKKGVSCFNPDGTEKPWWKRALRR